MIKAGWIYQLDRDTKAKAGFKKAKAFLAGRRPVDEWKKLYAVIAQEIPTAFFSGPGLAFYPSESAMEMLQPPIETYSLSEKSKVFNVEANVYRRVRNAFHLSILIPGKDRIVLEAPSEQERTEWMRALEQVRVTYGGETKAKRAFPKSVREGYLEKLGKQDQTWHPRYCLLAYNPGRLEYFFDIEDALAKNSRGSIVLDEAQVQVLASAYLDNPNAFTLTVPGGRRFVFAASSQEEVRLWVDDIAKLKNYVPAITLAEKEGKARAEIAKKIITDMEEKRQEAESADEGRLWELEEAKQGALDASLRAKERHVELRAQIVAVKAQLVESRHSRMQLELDIQAMRSRLEQVVARTTQLQVAHSQAMQDMVAVASMEEVLLAQEDAIRQREQAVRIREEENALKDRAIEDFAGVMSASI